MFNLLASSRSKPPHPTFGHVKDTLDKVTYLSEKQNPSNYEEIILENNLQGMTFVGDNRDRSSNAR
jgi:hypothetical protein